MLESDRGLKPAALLTMMCLIGMPSGWAATAGHEALTEDAGERLTSQDVRDELVPLSEEQAEALERLPSVREGLLTQPDDVDLRWTRAWCYTELDEYDLAIPEFERLLRENPEDQETAEWLAEAYQGKAFTLLDEDRQVDQALLAIDRALTLMPNDPMLLATRAAVLLTLGQLDKARASLRQAYAQAPQDPALREELQRLEAMMASPSPSTSQPVAPGVSH